MRRLSFILALALWISTDSFACLDPVDKILMVEGGDLAGDRSSFMIETPKRDMPTPEWEVCQEAVCHRRKNEASRGASVDELIFCRRPGSQTFFSIDEWVGLVNKPAESCGREEYPSVDPKKNLRVRECREKLYLAYVKDNSADCKRLKVKIINPTLGLVPKKKCTKEELTGFGTCCRNEDRCLRLDWKTGKLDACTAGEMKAQLYDADIR